MYFKYIKYLFLVLIVLSSCDDINRDNILDPKNPASERPQIITVEAFVNTTDSIPNAFNEYLLDALDELESSYSDKILISVNNRRIKNNFFYGYFIKDIELLYETYFQGYDSGVRGVPDVYINGIEARIQGASSQSTVLFRLEEVLNSLITSNSYFTIESNIIQDGNEYKISAKIARLGSTNEENIKVKAIIVSKYDNDLHERVVTDILKSQDIGNISNGEIKEIDLGEVPATSIDSDVIFMITSDDELQVFQSIKVDLN